MSIINAAGHATGLPHTEQSSSENRLRRPKDDSYGIYEILERVESAIAPVWPLKDYVAVNPYAGFANQKFLTARGFVQAVSDLELLMPVDYYREQFDKGDLHKEDIDAAVDEMVADGVIGAERIDVNQVVATLREESTPSPTADAKFTKRRAHERPLRTVAEQIDEYTGSSWCREIRDQISKHCALHYDQGQASWASLWQDLPLYQAWRIAAQHDRSFDVLGVAGFRKFVGRLPHQPHAALVTLLQEMGVPDELWSHLLHCEALATPGWSAWARYQQREAQQNGLSSDDFAGLLAMRLAYEVALSKRLDFRIDWNSVATCVRSRLQQAGTPSDEGLIRYCLLKASEIAFRTRLVNRVAHVPGLSVSESVPKQKLAQLVFCIDVRSERIRRHLEATSSDLETFGFAGFFGVPMEWVQFEEGAGSSQVPAVASPHFKVHEEFDVPDSRTSDLARRRRSTVRFLRSCWKDFQRSAIGSFGFVETTGLLYGFQLIARSVGKNCFGASRYDGVAKKDRHHLAPSLRGLEKQGVSLAAQVDLAESILRGIGILSDFGRLVIFCGHGSQTENNPLKAGLDCGACGGHSGEANARFAAKLLNQSSVRMGLRDRGIEIPEETCFVAALYNTTTDEVNFLDTHKLPDACRDDLEEIDSLMRAASKQTSRERLVSLPGRNTNDLIRRSRDWSEVRPEWGLAGNAAFVAAPRQFTESLPLDGQVFLHSYDYQQDADFEVLEQILTAPLVVANWINLQYYASTVDPIHFGSGNKTVHNVVGRFGIFSGNGGDLMTGLPWQSVHDGRQYQHHPRRLLALVAAPRAAIERIVSRHDHVADLLDNGWLHLVAIEDGVFYRLTERRNWEAIADATVAQPA